MRSSVPALVCVSPLVAFSLQLDERRTSFEDPADYDLTNPVPIAQDQWSSIDFYLGRGNFRPLGRFVEGVQRSVESDVSHATGLPIHVVHGLFRLLLVALLAWAVVGLVQALVRSASGVSDATHPIVEIAPIAVAAVVVAGGRMSAISAYPVTMLGIALLAFWLPQHVARERDMTERRTGAVELAILAVIGAALTALYDLAYVVPPMVVAFVGARAVASGMTFAALRRVAAVRRSLALSAGFLAAFVPVRLHIRSRCAARECYDASDAAFTEHAMRLLPDRLTTATPPAGWSYLFGASPSQGSVSNADVVVNGFVLAAFAVLAVAGYRAYVVAAARPRSVAEGRLAAALLLMAGVSGVAPALVVSVSRWLQSQQHAIGQGWRETVMIQVAWALCALGTLVWLADRFAPRRVFACGVAVLVAAASVTLVANARLARLDRQDPASGVMAALGVAALYDDPSERANLQRCSLIERYTELSDPEAFEGGPQLRVVLDEFSEKYYGYPFCR